MTNHCLPCGKEEVHSKAKIIEKLHRYDAFDKLAPVLALVPSGFFAGSNEATTSSPTQPTFYSLTRFIASGAFLYLLYD